MVTSQGTNLNMPIEGCSVLTHYYLEKTIFTQNIGISEHQKQEWVARGALFEISE
ncbi:MAG: hypothetical protein F6K24_41515 [Okeania sp. SIO2D1]|nr:hypothetical protein [Okeania sp. SIO2D1]